MPFTYWMCHVMVPWFPNVERRVLLLLEFLHACLVSCAKFIYPCEESGTPRYVAPMEVFHAPWTLINRGCYLWLWHVFHKGIRCGICEGKRKKKSEIKTKKKRGEKIKRRDKREKERQGLLFLGFRNFQLLDF